MEPTRISRRRTGGVLASFLLLAVALTGCGRFTERKIDRELDQHARNAGIAMDNVRYGGSVERARAVAGTAGNMADTGTTIEVLQADGGRRDGTIVLRITQVDTESEFESTKRSTRCYRYTFRNSVHDIDPHRVSRCTAVPALALPAPAPIPTLPLDTEDRLRTVLSAGGQDQSAVEQAATKAFAGTPDVVVDVAAQDGDTGVGVGIPGTDDNAGECELAHATGSPVVVQMWRMPAVLAQPGETPCTGYSALTDQGQQPPH